MALATNFQICATLQALQSYLYSIVGQYLKKLALLQRLASIIEQAGNGLAIPNISNLLPLGDINADTYNQIRCACPFLGLPPLSDTGLDNLLAQINKGYQALDQYLAAHPFSQMNALQDQLDSILAQIEQEALNLISPGMDVLGCLNAICAAANQLEVYSASFATSATSTYGNLTSSSTSSFTSVLSPTQQASANLVSSTRATLAELGNFTPPPAPPAVSSIFT